MKPLAPLTVAEAQARLERAARDLVRHAEWANPYSVIGHCYRARINSLRIPLAELRLARLLEKRRARTTTLSESVKLNSRKAC